jgi:hypothetical protein
MHDQWRDPKALIDAAAEKAAQHKGPPPVPPSLPRTLTLRRDSGHLSLDYALGSVEGRPGATQLVVTINSRDDARPPGTFAIPVSDPTGTLELAREVPDDQRCDVNVSAVSANGVSTAAVELDLDAGAMTAAFAGA